MTEPRTEDEAAPVIADAPVVKQTQRPHPLTPLVRGWLVLVAIVVGFGRELVPDGEQDQPFGLDDLRWLLPIIGGVVLIAAAAGFVSWYFTRYVVDDEELRVETGVLVKNSTKVPFERLQSVDIIQPLAARLFSLAELRLEVGAGDSTIKLRYLTRSQASRLRDYLLTRAHGQRARIADLSEQEAASPFTDLGSADHPLVRITPRRLVGSLLLSTEWLFTATITLTVLIVTASLGVLPYALPALIPLGIGAVSMVSRRVIAMFNFTLAESARGLRVTRGLTNLTSQSIPVSRIQGIKISQPLLWRLTGWYRMDVDILGYRAGGDGEDNSSGASGVLLPVASAAEVQIALDRVLPGIDVSRVALAPAPRRAAWVRWYDFWTLRSGYDQRILITENGWLTAVRNIVPHAKTQSVRIEQGPLQRRLRLADVHIHTPKGPVNAVARQLDAADARSLALSQLDRARAARAIDRERAALTATELTERDVLDSFAVGPDALLGSGGESRVFALDERRVLRLYHRSDPGQAEIIQQLAGLYGFWAGRAPLEVPQILEIGHRGGRSYTLDRRFSGRSLSGWLPTADERERRAALLSYLDAAYAMRGLPAPVPGFARLVGDGAPELYPTLQAVLSAQLNRTLARSRPDLDRDLPEASQIWHQLQGVLAGRSVVPAVVHGDFCPPNVYLSRAVDGQPVVTGVGDFSPHTLLADPMLDIVGAVIFLELENYPQAVGDARWLTGELVSREGRDAERWIWAYRRYYGFYFSDTCAVDPRLYAWCLAQLRGDAD